MLSLFKFSVLCCCLILPIHALASEDESGMNQDTGEAMEIAAYHSKEVGQANEMTRGFEMRNGGGQYGYSAPSNDADSLREKTQWFGMRFGGGNFGFSITFQLALLRWRWFYLEVLHLAGGGGGPGWAGDYEVGFFGKGGIRFGVPFHIGSDGRNEIRLGTGLSGGFAQNSTYGYDYYVLESFGPFVEFELYYVYHFSEYMALQTGVDVSVPTMNEEGDSDQEWMPAPIASLFVGFLM